MLIEDKRAHILSRLRMAVSIYDVYSGSELSLMKLTKKQDINRHVRIGRTERKNSCFGLSAIKLPAKVAAEKDAKQKLIGIKDVTLPKKVYIYWDGFSSSLQ